MRTADEVLKETEEAWKAPILPTILDMRGPKARVLTDLGKISQGIPDNGQPMPELQYNMDLLVEMTENEIKNLNVRLKKTEDLAVLMGREEKKLQTEQAERQEALERLQIIKQRLDSTIAQLDPLTDIDRLLTTFTELKDSVPEDFESCGIALIALDKVSWLAGNSELKCAIDRGLL